MHRIRSVTPVNPAAPTAAGVFQFRIVPCGAPPLGRLWSGTQVARTSPLHDPHYRVLIRRLVVARERGGLTQTEAARRLGKAQAYIAKVEGLYRRLDIRELWDLLPVYGITANDFYADPTAEELRAVGWRPGARRPRRPNA